MFAAIYFMPCTCSAPLDSCTVRDTVLVITINSAYPPSRTVDFDEEKAEINRIK